MTGVRSAIYEFLVHLAFIFFQDRNESPSTKSEHNHTPGLTTAIIAHNRNTENAFIGTTFEFQDYKFRDNGHLISIDNFKMNYLILLGLLAATRADDAENFSYYLNYVIGNEWPLYTTDPQFAAEIGYYSAAFNEFLTIGFQGYSGLLVDYASLTNPFYVLSVWAFQDSVDASYDPSQFEPLPSSVLRLIEASQTPESVMASQTSSSWVRSSSLTSSSVSST